MEENKNLSTENALEQEEKSTFDFQTIYTTLILNWKWFVLSLIICLGIAAIYLRYKTPVYQAYAKMLIKDEDNNRGRNSIMNATALGTISNSAGIDNEMEILKSRSIAELGLYPAIDPLASTSNALDPMVVGEEHYRVATQVQEMLQQYSDLQDIIAILGMDELSEDQKLVVNRARKLQQFLSQSFHVAEQFTGNPGVYMKLEDTVRSFAEIIDGKCDDLPEQAFRYASTIEDVRERAAKMANKD